MIKTQGPTDDYRRCATTSTKSDIAVGPGPDLAETPPRTCPRAVAQNNRSPLSQQKAITTGEGNRLRNPFNTQPAVAARKHGKVRQICWGSLFAGRRDFFCGLIFLSYPPRSCGFEPMQAERGYVHGSEDVCYWVHCSLPTWTNRQKFRTLRQFSSIARRIYSCVSDVMRHAKEQVWESLKVRLQSSRADQAVWRWRAPSASLKKARTFSSRASGRWRPMRRPSRQGGT